MVGVALPRSAEMLVALLGIVKAGAAYLPLDPTYPQERLEFMVDDVKPACVLTTAAHANRLPTRFLPILFESELQEHLTRQSILNPDSSGRKRKLSSQHLAYVIYTSGSTGVPKGIGIEHRNTVAFLTWAQDVFRADLSAVLASTSICFDLSIFELFAPLSCGGTVVIADNALQLPSLAAQQVTLLNTVPAAMSEFLRLKWNTESLRTVNLAGEALTSTLVEELQGIAGIRILNLYGPSEDTTYSTYWLCSAGPQRSIPIGRPIANTQAVSYTHLDVYKRQRFRSIE